jgi:MFS transporter, FSR family, fosmidomycin resistance protein
MAVEQTATAPALSVQAKFGGSATVVILVSLAHAMSHAYGALLPLIVPFFQSELQLTYTQIGIMFSVTNLVWGPLQLGFGILGRYRSRKLLLGFGHICQGLAVVGTGFVHGFTDLLTWRVVSRIADAPQHPIGNALISHSFGPERRGLALAINAAGSNLGTVAVPLLGGLLIATIGWRHTLLLWGLLGVGVGALVVGFLNEQQRTTRDNQGMAKIWGEVWALLRHRDALLLMASHVIGAGGRGLGVATLYVPLYLSQTLHLQDDPVRLGQLVTIMMAGSVIGPLLVGPLSDRVGRKPVLLVDAVIACACYLALLFVAGQSWALLGLLAVAGLAIYSEGALMQTALADVADKTSIDMLFGLYFTIGAAIGAPWAALLGWLVDHYGFSVGFVVMAGSQLLAGLCVLPVRLRHTRRVASRR